MTRPRILPKFMHVVDAIEHVGGRLWPGTWTGKERFGVAERELQSAKWEPQLLEEKHTFYNDFSPNPNVHIPPGMSAFPRDHHEPTEAADWVWFSRRKLELGATLRDLEADAEGSKQRCADTEKACWQFFDNEPWLCLHQLPGTKDICPFESSFWWSEKADEVFRIAPEGRVTIRYKGRAVIPVVHKKLLDETIDGFLAVRSANPEMTIGDTLQVWADTMTPQSEKYYEIVRTAPDQGCIIAGNSGPDDAEPSSAAIAKDNSAGTGGNTPLTSPKLSTKEFLIALYRRCPPDHAPPVQAWLEKFVKEKFDMSRRPLEELLTDLEEQKCIEKRGRGKTKLQEMSKSAWNEVAEKVCEDLLSSVKSTKK